MGYVALRLEGPLQSWGFDSQYNRRNTGLMPTRSAIAGMCCAAIGFPRGSHEEENFLKSFGSIRMTTIAISRNVDNNILPVRRLQDFHTVQNTRRASGEIDKDCVITHRQYLMDAAFGVLLEGNYVLLNKIAEALTDPKWGIYLGRKACIPSAPVLAGLKKNRTEALYLLIGENSLESFTHQVEVESFAEGRDTLPDVPVSFKTARRLFSIRRVQTIQGIGHS